MKNFILLILVLMPIALLAQEYDDEPEICYRKDWTLDVRVAFLHPTSTKLREIYSNGWIDYQVQATKRLNRNIELWAEIDWAHKKGTLSNHNLHHRSKIYIAPATLGGKLIFPITSHIDAYAGAGICLSSVSVKNRWHFKDSRGHLVRVSDSTRKTAVGGLFKSGFRISAGKCTYFDFFADYFLQHFPSGKYFGRRENLNCSSYKLGAGFGVYF